MIFGDHVRAPESSAAAARVMDGCRGAWGTVGSFVPEGHERCVRVHPPASGLDDWWGAYRSLYGTVAAVGAEHTATPDRAWFGIWEGYGWETSTTVYGWTTAAEDARRRELDARRNEVIRAGLAPLPKLERPHRAYYLLEGPVASVVEVREPGAGDRWQRPDLFWPDDCQWHVATDVDCWSLYVGGSAELVSDLVTAVPTAVEDVTLDQPLVPED